MRCGRRVSVAPSVAMAFMVCCVGVSAGPVWAGDDGVRFLLVSGADLWRMAASCMAVCCGRPQASTAKASRCRPCCRGGSYRYQSGALNNAWVNGAEEEIQLLPG